MSWERYKNSKNPSTFEVAVKIGPNPLIKYFEPSGEPKVIFHNDGTISVGLSRFYEVETEADFERFKVKYGELPKEVRKAIQKELRKRAKGFLTSRPGRPQGSGQFENEQQFRNQIGEIVRNLDKQGERVTQKKVAEIYNCDPRQLRTWCGDFTGLKWRDFVSEILDV